MEETDWHSIPNGGTPNIYRITVDKTLSKKKEYGKSERNIVPIKEILAERRHIKPFLAIDELNSDLNK
jgi:hypothetical protein